MLWVYLPHTNHKSNWMYLCYSISTCIRTIRIIVKLSVVILYIGNNHLHFSWSSPQSICESDKDLIYFSSQLSFLWTSIFYFACLSSCFSAPFSFGFLGYWLSFVFMGADIYATTKTWVLYLNSVMFSLLLLLVCVQWFVISPRVISLCVPERLV